MVISKSNLNLFLMTGLMVFSSLHVWALFEIGIVVTGIEFALFFASFLIVVNFQSGISKSFLKFIFLFLILQGLNVISILINGNTGQLSSVLKNVVYLVLPIGIYMGIKYSNPKIYKRSYLITLAFFLLSALYFGAQKSVDFGLFFNFVRGGSFAEVQYGVFHKLFDDYRLVYQEGASASAFRHGILFVFLITFLLSKFHTSRNGGAFKFDYRDVIIIVLNLLFFSRQVLVCTFFYYLLLVLFNKKNIYFRFFLGLSILMFFVLFLTGFSININENIYDKLVYDVLNNPRINDFKLAFEYFGENVLTGVGYGTLLHTGRIAHNLLISQLHQTGFFGGVIAFFLMAYLIRVCVSSVFLFVKHQASIYLILACLVTIPLSKMLFGAGGDLDFASWFAVGVMFFIKEQLDRQAEIKRGNI